MKTKNVLLTVMLVCAFGLVARAQVESTIGSDADTYVSGADIMGDKDYMSILGGGADDAGYVRFDLATINVNTVLDAQLILRNSPTVDSAGHDERNDGINSGRLALYGLNNVEGNTPQDWDENTLTESTAGAEWTGTVPLDLTGGRVTNLDADDGVAITEDIVDDPGLDYWVAGNYTITISGQALIDFLQARADDDGLVTFIIASDDSNTRGYGIGTKENATEEYRPVLVLTYIAGGAINPVPADNSTITDLNLPDLCWENSNVERANIWFGSPADANELNYKDRLALIGTIDSPAVNTCFPVPAEDLPLAVPETYFWAVEAYTYPASDPNHIGEPNELLSEKVWKFSTSEIPVALTEPADQFVFPGASAAFSVQYEGLTPVTDAAWYLNGTDVETLNPGDVSVSITDDGGDFYTVTLTVNNAELADEGIYYCIAENTGGFSEPSVSADLVVKRRLAYWSFENALTDAEGNYDGTAAVDPNYADSYAGAASDLGEALLLDGTTDYVILPAGFENFKAGLTFVVWANPSAVAGWARFIDLGNGPGVDNIFLTREGTTNNLIFNNNEGVVNAPDAITLNEWQMFVAATDEAGNVVLYKNGLPVQNGTVGVPAVIERTLNYIGDSNYTSDALYAGLLDEISVYNYALTEDQAAEMYAGVYGDFCRYPEIPGEFDYNDNCIIDLPDFAEFAANWLSDGLFPSND